MSKWDRGKNVRQRRKKIIEEKKNMTRFSIMLPIVKKKVKSEKRMTIKKNKQTNKNCLLLKFIYKHALMSA